MGRSAVLFVELDLLLDLLGEALSSKVSPAEAAEIVSSDGGLRIVLEPTGDGVAATIATSVGRLTGPDHWITIEDVFSPMDEQVPVGGALETVP